MTQRVRDAFIEQGKACERLGSPFMARLMPLIAARLDPASPVGAACLGWQGEPGPRGHSLPLRLAGALHGLVLDGTAPALAAVYPPNEADDDALWGAVAGAMAQHAPRVLDWLTRAPQTNEVRRAAAITAALCWAQAQVGPRPVILSELGASAGLNLNLDRFAVMLDGQAIGPDAPALRLAPEWRGPHRPDPQPVRVIDRRGVDLAPLDPADPDDRLRLLAYLWPDQPDRLARTRAAISLPPAPVDAEDAAPWLERRLRHARPGALHVVYSTIAAQYFPAETRAAITAHLHRAGAAASADAPLIHVEMEADDAAPGAGLTAALWAGGAAQRVSLGRVDFHGAWIAWSPATLQD